MSEEGGGTSHGLGQQGSFFLGPDHFRANLKLHLNILTTGK